MNGFADAAVPPITGPALDNKRVAAALIDLLVLFVVGVLLGTLAGAYTTAGWLVSIGWTLYYYFAFEALTGQTLGKKLMGLRVATVDGSPPELRHVAIRTVLRLVDGFGLYLVGLVAMLATGERRQRLGDLAAGTIVTTAVEAPAEEPAEEAPALPAASVFDLPVGPEPELEPVEAEFVEVEPEAVAPEAVEPEPVEHEPVEDDPVEDEPGEYAPIEDEPLDDEPVAGEGPYIELVPDPPAESDEPAEGDPPRIDIVSPIDLVMGEDEGDEPPPPQPA